MRIYKPEFRTLQIKTPTAEQVHSDKKTKYNRFAYEWYMENTVQRYFNLTQSLAEEVHAYTKSLIRKTAILAATSTAIGAFGLIVAVIALKKER